MSGLSLVTWPTMKNYYAILQLMSTESPAAISARYRDITRRVLNRKGDERISGLQEIVKAYDVLSDPSRKRVYDERLAQLHTEQPSSVVARSADVDVRPNSIFGDTDNVYPSLEALRERLLRNLTGRGIPKGEQSECLAVEVVVNRDEATLGGVVYIGMPAYRYCPICRGMAPESFSPCARCEGWGVLEELNTVSIDMPPHVASKTIFEVSLENIGIHNLFLRGHISISG